MTSLLFIYGTLLLSDNEFGIYLRKNSVVVGQGKFRGYLYDVDEYPAAIADSKADSFIFGTIVELSDSHVLKTIDRYEGYGENEQQPWLYIRKLEEVETDKGKVDCWVYLYNHPIDNLRLIPYGDYLNYIK